MEQEPVDPKLTQIVLDGKHDEIWRIFSHLLSRVSAACRIDMLASTEKRAVFLSHWMLFHTTLQELTTPLCSDLEKVAAAHEGFMLSEDWVYRTSWDLLEQVVVAKCGMNISDAWREAVFSPEVTRDWLSWRKGHKRDTPDPIVGEEPVPTLKPLHDRHRRRDEVHKLFPGLVQEIEEAWTAWRQSTPREEIRNRSRLIREVGPPEFDDLLNNVPGRDARTWAADIVATRTGLSVATIKKYGQPNKHRR